jgi:hypothetical protein
MDMTGIVILNAVLVASVVAGIVGLLAWSVVSSTNRPQARRTESVRARRRQHAGRDETRKVSELRPADLELEPDARGPLARPPATSLAVDDPQPVSADAR